MEYFCSSLSHCNIKNCSSLVPALALVTKLLLSKIYLTPIGWEITKFLVFPYHYSRRWSLFYSDVLIYFLINMWLVSSCVRLQHVAQDCTQILLKNLLGMRLGTFLGQPVSVHQHLHSEVLAHIQVEHPWNCTCLLPFVLLIGNIWYVHKVFQKTIEWVWPCVKKILVEW